MSIIQQHDTKQTQTVLIDSNSFASTMIVALLDYYGPRFLSWAPETIKIETEDDFDFQWSTSNYNRLMAGITVLTTDSFYNELPIFIELSNLLSGSPIMPGVFNPADAVECAWAITEVLLLSPPDKEDLEPFSQEICAYIGKVLDDEGIIVPPDILKIAVRTKDLKADVHNSWSDDPEMYTAIWETEDSKTEDINSTIKNNLMELFDQLESLNLVNGSTKNIIKKMRKQVT